MSKIITKKVKNLHTNMKSYGRTYGHVVYTETLSLSQFAQHISTHGSPFSRGTIMGVLTSMCECLVELTLDSKRVSLGDLGTFSMRLTTVGEENEDDFSVNNNAKGLRLHFTPNLSKENCLNSKINLSKASFIDQNTLLGIKKDQEEESGGSGDEDGEEDRP